MPESRAPGAPPGAKVFDLPSAIALTVGLVVGSGIFKAPSVVAANAADGGAMLFAWLLGGVVSLVGALCYAELATAFPSTGGDYHFLARAYGARVAFLFAWARLAVITTGSVAMLAFVFGDYCTRLLPLGAGSSTLYAVAAVLWLTAVNVSGVRRGARAQNWLTVLEVAGLLAVVATGWLADPVPAVQSAPSATSPERQAFGLGMVFVLLTYGGWNEAAYISAELRDVRRNMLRALVWSMVAITTLYLLVNAAYLRGLGMEAMARSGVVAATLMERVWGDAGARAISAIIAVSALSSINATIIVGARSSHALGRDWPALSMLGRWNPRSGSPTVALVLQGGVALALIGFGTVVRSGFETMVDYTAPVFWLFFLLVGIALFVLRRREPHAVRPFRVPLYPVLPLVFCGTSAWLLYASLAYTRLGALVGVAVLAAGLPLLAWAARRGAVRDARGPRP